jgi:hypothetical protein
LTPAAHPHTYGGIPPMLRDTQNLNVVDMRSIVDVASLPLLLRIGEAVKVSGLSRSEIYKRLREGTIKAKKMRSATMILTESLAAVADLRDL